MSTKQRPPKNQSGKADNSKRNLILGIVGGVVGLGLIVWLAFAIANEGSTTDAVAFGEVTVEGADLPFFDATAADPAVGVTAPTVTGEDWNGNQYTIGADGRAKIIVMLAHWCPHCQRELPLIQNWVDNGGVPEGVDLYGITVLTNRLRDGSTYPPSTWLEGAGWSSPTLMDDEAQSIVAAYGLTSTPTYVVLGPDNENLGRIAGEIGTAGLDALAQIAAGSLES